MPKRTLRWWIARGLLAITGWKPSGVRPEHDRCVVIAAPHTTNWDFFYLLVFAAYFQIEINWMGKHSLFRPPMGWFMRAVGGIPVVRHRRENLVTSLARAFEERESLRLIVPAEGTRSRSEYWKSGFYHIARTADVPIVLGFLDYTKKEGGFGPAIQPSGDIRKDMDEIRAFYRNVKGKYPKSFSPIRLREEDDKQDSEHPDAPTTRSQETSATKTSSAETR